MRSGRLRHTAIFQYDQGSTADAYGQPAQDWVRRAKRRASIWPLSGKEFEAAQQTYGETSHEILVRHDSATELITNKDRAWFDGRLFNITHVLNPNERNKQLQIYAVELVGETYTPATVAVPTPTEVAVGGGVYDYVFDFAYDIVEGPQEVDGWTLELGVGGAVTITSVRIENGNIKVQATPGAQQGEAISLAYDGTNGSYFAANEYEFTQVLET